MEYVDKIVNIESSGNRFAKSSKGAVGLMQITKPVVKDWNKDHPNDKHTMNDLTDPEINKKIGTWYWDEKIPEYLSNEGIPDNDLHRAAAYNWGIGKTSNWYDSGAGFSKLPEQTQNWYSKFIHADAPGFDSDREATY